LGAIARNRQQQNFKYRGIDDIYNNVQPLEAKYGLFSLPEVLDENYSERTSKSGTILFHTRLKIRYHFFASDGSAIHDTVVVGEGMDSGDKGANKAMSIAHKYALTQAYAIRTTELIDPDAESHEVVPHAKPSSGAAKPLSTVKAPSSKVVSSAPPEVLPFEIPYIIPFGKFKGRDFNDIKVEDLVAYKDWLKAKSREEQRPIENVDVRAFVRKVEEEQLAADQISNDMERFANEDV
jgi:hypothetical protein